MSVVAALGSLRVIPVVEITDVAHAVPLARALTAAGLPAMEITLRTDAALDSIRAIADDDPTFAVGAGTLLTAKDVNAAAAAGSRFLVSPGLTDALSAAAEDNGLPFVPGAVTASEMMRAVEAGYRILKFFPAEQSGGAAAIRSLSTPLRALGIQFMPTGGVRAETLTDYLAISAVFAVGGTWIAPRDILAAERFDIVSDRARAALAVVTTPVP